MKWRKDKSFFVGGTLRLMLECTRPILIHLVNFFIYFNVVVLPQAPEDDQQKR